MIFEQRNTLCHQTLFFYRYCGLVIEIFWEFNNSRFLISLWNILRYLEISRDILPFLEIFWDYSRYFEISWDILRFLKIYWHILIYFEILWDILRYLEIVWHFTRYFEISWDIMRYLGIFWDFLIEFETSRDISNYFWIWSCLATEIPATFDLYFSWEEFHFHIFSLICFDFLWILYLWEIWC